MSIQLDKSAIEPFCKQWKVKELALFGSALRKDFRPDSDVDVLVTFRNDADWSLFDMVTMQEELGNIVGRKVDLVNRESIALYRLALRSPRLGRLWMKMLGETAKRSPLFVYRQQMNHLPEVDRAVFDAQDMRGLRIRDLAEAFRQGSEGPAQEAMLHVQDWGFALSAVQVDIYLWQGELDRQHPVAMGRYLTREIPRCHAVFAPSLGAFGFIAHLDDIFDELLGHPARHTPVHVAGPQVAVVPPSIGRP